MEQIAKYLSERHLSVTPWDSHGVPDADVMVRIAQEAWETADNTRGGP